MQEATLQRLAVASLVVCLGVVLGCIAFFDPWWGLMDDHTNVKMLGLMDAQGIIPFSAGYLQQDIHFGMMRPFYPAMVYAIWWVGMLSPSWAFAFNALLVLGSLLFFARGWNAALEKSGQPPLLSPVATAVFCLAVFWFHDQFWYPSLQEKMVLAWAGVVLLLWARLESHPGTPAWCAVMVPLLLVGMLTKGQFAVFLPCLVLLQAVSDHRHAARRYARTAVLALWSGALVLALKLVANQGYYAGQFGLAQGLENLKSPVALLVLALALAALAHAWVTGVDRVQRILLGLPGVTLLAFLAIMLPRGVGGFIVSVVAPVVACATFQLLRGRPAIWTSALLLGVLVAAPAVTAYRNVRSFARSNDLRRIIFSSELGELHAHNRTLLVPCEEGAVGMRFYIQQVANVPLEVRDAHALTPAERKALLQQDTWWFGDEHNCRLGAALNPSDVAALETIVAPNFKGGFQLARLPAR